MKTETNRGRGRPAGSIGKNNVDQNLPRIRVTEEQLKRYKGAADKAGVSLSAWIRKSLDSATESQ